MRLGKGEVRASRPLRNKALSICTKPRPWRTCSKSCPVTGPDPGRSSRCRSRKSWRAVRLAKTGRVIWPHYRRYLWGTGPAALSLRRRSGRLGLRGFAVLLVPDLRECPVSVGNVLNVVPDLGRFGSMNFRFRRYGSVQLSAPRPGKTRPTSSSPPRPPGRPTATACNIASAHRLWSWPNTSQWTGYAFHNGHMTPKMANNWLLFQQSTKVINHYISNGHRPRRSCNPRSCANRSYRSSGRRARSGPRPRSRRPARCRKRCLRRRQSLSRRDGAQ